MFRLLLLLILGLFGAMYFADNLPAPERAAVEPQATDEEPVDIVETILDSVFASVEADPILAPPVAEELVKFSSPMIVNADGTLTAEAPQAEIADVIVAEAQTAEITGPLDVRFVAADRVNVRSGPSTQFGVVGQVLYADAVQVVAEDPNGWVHIRIEGDGLEGYMAARFLEVVQN